MHRHHQQPKWCRWPQENDRLVTGYFRSSQPIADSMPQQQAGFSGNSMQPSPGTHQQMQPSSHVGMPYHQQPPGDTTSYIPAYNNAQYAYQQQQQQQIFQQQQQQQTQQQIARPAVTGVGNSSARLAHPQSYLVQQQPQVRMSHQQMPTGMMHAQQPTHFVQQQQPGGVTSVHAGLTTIAPGQAQVVQQQQVRGQPQQVQSTNGGGIRMFPAGSNAPVQIIATSDPGVIIQPSPSTSGSFQRVVMPQQSVVVQLQQQQQPQQQQQVQSQQQSSTQPQQPQPQQQLTNLSGNAPIVRPQQQLVSYQATPTQQQQHQPQPVIAQAAPQTAVQLSSASNPIITTAAASVTPTVTVKHEAPASTPATASPMLTSMSSAASSSAEVLTKQRLDDLVREVDPYEQLDDDVKETLLQIADEFIESVVTNACQLAKHRKANAVDVKDVQLCLERNWNMWIPGFGTDDLRPYKKACVTDAHKQRMALIKKTLKKV